MYELRDITGSILYKIDSNAQNGTITLYDSVNWEVGHGIVITHALSASSINLVDNKGVCIGRLDRELGIDGKPDCVVFSNSDFSRSIPLEEFGNPYIAEQLFGDYLKNRKPLEQENAASKPGEEGGVGRFLSGVVLLVIAGVIFSFARTLLLRNEEIVTLVVGTIIPILAGLIIFFICLVQKGESQLRIAGTVEGVFSAVLVALALRFGLPGGIGFGNSWYYQGMERFNATEGFASVLFGLGFALVMFILFFLPYVALAGVFRLTAFQVRDSGWKTWLFRTNRRYHTVVQTVGSALFYLTLIIYETNTFMESLLVGVFYAAFLLIAFRLSRKISNKILR